METLHPLPLNLIPAEAAPAQRPVRHLWPLMGDVISARAGVPELLIQWHRAEGAEDPDPQR